jgi:hypothetical protein
MCVQAIGLDSLPEWDRILGAKKRAGRVIFLNQRRLVLCAGAHIHA